MQMRQLHMRGARWIVLGSGGGEAAPDRVSPGHLLETPEAAVLFDRGDGVTGSFLRLGGRVEDVDAICISHQVAVYKVIFSRAEPEHRSIGAGRSGPALQKLVRWLLGITHSS